MRAIPAVAVTTTGKVVDVQAVQVGCPECEGVTFELYVLDGHNHLRCNNCGTSFCQAGAECSLCLSDDPRTGDREPSHG